MLPVVFQHPSSCCQIVVEESHYVQTTYRYPGSPHPHTVAYASCRWRDTQPIVVVIIAKGIDSPRNLILFLFLSEHHHVVHRVFAKLGPDRVGQHPNVSFRLSHPRSVCQTFRHSQICLELHPRFFQRRLQRLVQFAFHFRHEIKLYQFYRLLVQLQFAVLIVLLLEIILEVRIQMLCQCAVRHHYHPGHHQRPAQYIIIFHNSCLLSFHSTALQPVFVVISFVQAAHHYTHTGRCMYKFSVLQINPHMRCLPFLLPVVEEHQVSLLEVPFQHPLAVSVSLFLRAPAQFLPVHLSVYCRCQSRTVHTLLRGSSVPVWSSNPVCSFQIQLVVILHLYVHVQPYGSHSQVSEVIAHPSCAAR